MHYVPSAVFIIFPKGSKQMAKVRQGASSSRQPGIRETDSNRADWRGAGWLAGWQRAAVRSQKQQLSN